MKRLESLDVVRGLDMFFLTTLGPLLYSFFRAGDFACSDAALWFSGRDTTTPGCSAA